MRGEAAGAGLGGSGAACAGLVAAACLAAAASRARSPVRRRATEQGSFNQVSVIPSGETKSVMTDDEQADFLQKRCDSIEKHMPMSDEEFDEELAELTWKWARHLIPFTDYGRANLAAFKRRTILRQKEFYQKMRLFKPMALKYPTLMRRLIVTDVSDTEEIKYKINGEWIANEEKIAGFTYEDLAVETDGGKFTQWELPKAGEVVSGVVVDFSEEGAYLDIGAKAWAFMPLDQVSLVPISNAAEVLQLGEEVEVKVLAQGSFSRLGGDPFATQFVVSATALQSTAAWDKIDSIMSGEAEETLLTVTVMAVRSFGAVVLTNTGLEALIPNSQLADRAGDTGLVGKEIKVQIFKLRKDLISEGPAMRPNEFPLLLSYKNVATQELFDEVEEGQVLDATVKSVRELSLDIMVGTVQCSIRKVDISGSTRFNIADLFEANEEVKVYVLSKLKESSEIRLSMRALERKKGELLTDKAGVFERAEKTASIYYKRANVEKQKAFDTLANVLETPGDFSSPLPKKEAGTVDLDDDEDDDLSF